MKKYYVEFQCMATDTDFVLQSVWFESEEDAITWYRYNFDHVDTEEMRVFLMCADFDENNEMGDIEHLGDITSKYYLQPPKGEY